MKRILILAVAWLALSAVAAAAQTTATANLSITIPTVLKIVNNTGDWTMPAPTAAQAETGATLQSTNQLDIETTGNVAYKVTATAPAFTFTEVSTPDAGYVKAASDATLVNTTVAASAALNSGSSVITRSRGHNHDNVRADLTITTNDPAGSYTTLVTFTIAAQ